MQVARGIDVIAGRLTGREHDEVLIRCEHSARGKLPFLQIGVLIGEVESGEVKTVGVAVVNLDPVGRIPVPVIEAAVARDELADLRRQFQTVDGDLDRLTGAALGVGGGEGVDLGRAGDD